MGSLSETKAAPYQGINWQIDKTLASCPDSEHQWGSVTTGKDIFAAACTKCSSTIWWSKSAEPPTPFTASIGNSPLQVQTNTDCKQSADGIHQISTIVADEWSRHARCKSCGRRFDWGENQEPPPSVVRALRLSCVHERRIPDEIGEGGFTTRWKCLDCSEKIYTPREEVKAAKTRLPKKGMVKVQNLSPFETLVSVNDVALEGVSLVSFTHIANEVPRVEVEFNHDRDGAIIFEGHMWARRPPAEVVALVEEYHGPVSQTEPGCICGDEFEGSLVGHIADVAYDYATGQLSGDLPPIDRSV